MNTYKYTYSKTKVTLSVDKNLIKMAKENRINISRFLEEKLREYFTLMKTDAAGFEPATTGLEGQRPVLARPRALENNNRKLDILVIRKAQPHAGDQHD